MICSGGLRRGITRFNYVHKYSFLRLLCVVIINVATTMYTEDKRLYKLICNLYCTVFYLFYNYHYVKQEM